MLKLTGVRTFQLQMSVAGQLNSQGLADIHVSSSSASIYYMNGTAESDARNYWTQNLKATGPQFGFKDTDSLVTAMSHPMRTRPPVPTDVLYSNSIEWRPHTGKVVLIQGHDEKVLFSI